jgi:hypothetical protein
MTPTALRRLLISAPVVALAVNVGCASLNPEGWDAKTAAAPLPAVFVPVSRARIQQECPKTPNAIGCAVRSYERGVCWVYIPADAPPWLVDHELLHCAGYNHRT